MENPQLYGDQEWGGEGDKGGKGEKNWGKKTEGEITNSMEKKKGFNLM